MSLFGSLAAIGTAIGTAASAIGAPAAAAATAAGASTATAGAIGTTVGSAVLGSASGAALSAATGGDPGQGALMGAVTGGATGGLGALGSGAGTAGQAAGQAGQAAQTATQAITPAAQATTQLGSTGATSAAKAFEAAGLTSGGAPISGAVPASSTSGITSAGIAGPGGMLPVAQTANTGVGALAKDVGMEIAKEGAGMAAEKVASAIPTGSSSPKMGFDQRQLAQDEETERKVGNVYKGANSRMNFASGGEVGLKEGQFIIPADVVSALGNGSTKAGAEFLNEFFGV